ncbi:Ig-like domain-containing protein [Clostridium tarantellae]|uniref:DUF4982 domain-containing protein n=1 Tax=Clostridium tarantellae TaxID=39493 RepID=A0A6I1MV41_9CLOT|nr:Ig-like domain-containing protein [Clostridium tarantellae]MPQ44069.1 DUF4982 domain-containing protein [Clostridium tarantellae]
MKKVLALIMTASLITNFSVTSVLATESAKNMEKTITKLKTELIKNDSRKIDFTQDWKFNLGNVNGAESNNFDDSSWRTLDLPHDWSIELDFNPNSVATHEGGWLDGGTAWYRKTFTLEDSMKGKEISIDFDGVYMESEIYVNGTKVGEYQNGYTPFSFNIEDNLKFNGEENIIAVKVVNRQPSSRWYSGSGIYRNVYLTVTDPIHVDRYGTFVTTPTLEEDLKIGNGVNVNVKTEINNTKNIEKTVNIKSKIFSPRGELVSEYETNEVLSVGINNINHNLTVQNPTLWGVYNGNMYKVITEVEMDGNIVDTYETPFGFRYFEFDEDKGFSLNGENMKLNGVCMHHDLGALGSAVNYDAVERQILMLKDMGVNAIRITHNPASNEFIKICEREGILLIDEAFDCWEQSKKTYDYGRFFNQYAKRDIQAMVDRGKNSPSIIMWSIGNEIYDTNNAKGVTIAKNLVKWIKEIDPTRPTTIGEDKYRGNKEDDVPNYHTYRDQVMEAVDIVGYNYSENVYDVHHADNPERKMYGSEISSAVRSRGVYLDPNIPNISDYDNLQTSSYDNSVVGWGRSMEDSTKRDRDRQFSAGQFIWTGFDYIGEPTPFYNSFPAKSSYFGAIDTAGFEKDAFYFYQSQWTEEPMLHLLPHWNWKEGENIKVWAYSNVDTVELFLNGESLGERSFENKTTNYGKNYLETSDGKLHLEWDIPFQKGTIKAVAKKDGVIVAEDEITTAGEAAAIKMTPEKKVIEADGKSLSFIEVDVVDENGIMVPDADNLIEFKVTGGEIVGVDNGNAASVERFKDDKRKAFSGKALLIVQADETEGTVTVEAKSKGLDSDLTTVYKINPSEENNNKIVGIEPILINLTKGEKLNLPTEVEATYGNSNSKMVSVTWDTINEDDFDKIGVVKVKGTVEGTSIKAEAIITIRDIIGVKPYSTVTKVGEVPILPQEAYMIYSDGKEKSSSVVWEEIDPSKYAEVGTYIVEGIVEGTANYKAESRIRVTNETTRTNIALSSAPTKGIGIASQTGSGDSTSHLNDGIISFNNSPKNRWTNWPATSNDWAGIEWKENQTFDNMNLYIYSDSGCEAPTSLVIEYFDGQNWIPVSNMEMTPAVPVNNTKHEITFDTVTTNKIRVNMTPTSGKSLALTEIEIFGELITENDDAKLSEILINGEVLEDFSPDKTEYEIKMPYGAKIPEIKVSTVNNGVETIIPPTSLPGEATITVTSESGKNEQVYTIKFIEEDPYLNEAVISVPDTNVKEDDLIDLDIKAYLVNGELINNNDATIEFITSDKSVVEIRNGQLAIVGGGEAEIYINVTYKDRTVTSNKLNISSTPSNVEKIILSLNEENIITGKGVLPVLPKTITANYNVGLSKEKTVIWDDINPEDYKKVGSFKVYGKVEGTSIKAVANVEVKGEIAIQNISTVTLVGEEPILPGEVTVYYSDGAEVQLPVSWEKLSKRKLSKTGEYTLQGNVEGSNLKATATVRVSEDFEKGLNISRFQNGYDYPRTAASYSNEPPISTSSNDRLSHINNDIISFDDSPHDRWTNWKSNPDKDGWVSVEFGRSGPQEYYVDEMTVNYFTDHGIALPKSAKVQYKQNGEWKNVTGQSLENGEFNNTRVYKFDKVKTSELRLVMNAENGKSLGITELQVYKNDVIKNTNNKASEIKLNGNLISNFNPETLEYEVILNDNDFPKITAKAEENASVTVVPATYKIGKSKIIVTAEDGSSTIYEINFIKNEDKISKEKLEEKINITTELLSGNYTEETLKILNDALNYAKKVYMNEKSTQYEVDSAATMLQDAIDQLVELEISADINKDGKVDIGDLSLAAKYYGQEKSEYDLNGDNIIDEFEINYISGKILEQ